MKKKKGNLLPSEESSDESCKLDQLIGGKGETKSRKTEDP